MPRTFTLAQLRDRAMSLADLQSNNATNFIPPAEWNAWLSSAYTELYDLLCDNGLAYSRSSTTVTTVAGQATYPLPPDFLQVVKVEYSIDPQNWDPLPYMDEREDHRVVNTGARAFFYRLENNNIVLLPAPTAGGQTYRVRYVPVAQDLVSDAQTVDGVNGWEKLLVLDAAIHGLRKEEADTAGLERDRERMLLRIKAMSHNRALTGGGAQVFDAYADESDRDPADFRWM